MATPVVSSVSYNKAAYAKGEQITVTMTYSDADSKVVTGTGKAVDQSGNEGTMSASFIIDPVTTSFTDSDGRVYTKVSDNGTVAVFTAVA